MSNPCSINWTPITAGDKPDRYAEFWKPLLQELNRRGEMDRDVNNTDAHFNGPSIGVGGVTRRMRLTEDGKARVEIWIRSPNEAWNKGMLDLLQKTSKTLETEIGAKLIWDRTPENKSCWVGIAIGGSICDSQERLDKIRCWMLKYVVKFDGVFRQRLKDARDRMKQ